MIESPVNRNNYIGNGAADTYPYTFPIVDETHLRVTVRLVGAAELPLTLHVHYEVAGVGDSGGGDIVLTAGAFAWLTANKLTTAVVLSLRRVVPLTQNTDVRNQGTYFAEMHENVFDYLTSIDQQQQDEIDRAIKMPETVSAGSFDPTMPAGLGLYPGAALIVNGAGTGFSIGVGIAAADVTRIAGYDTYPNFKAAAAAQPGLTRQGYAHDIKQLVFYTTDQSVGDDGWITWGG